MYLSQIEVYTAKIVMWPERSHYDTYSLIFFVSSVLERKEIINY